MKYTVIDLDEAQTDEIDAQLEAYDKKHFAHQLEGYVSVGIEKDGTLIAGANGCMTAHRIFYLSTLFVQETERGQGIGRIIMEAVEEKAKALGANIIRLDTFNWQGVAFYNKIGYKQVGEYACEEDGYTEHFFVKRI